MHIDIYGVGIDTPKVTFYLWSPWRSSFLEHRLFDAVKAISPTITETTPDEVRWVLPDAKSWKTALQNCARVLKGWQEEATDTGTERRAWRWLLEADTDIDGYDHTGEKSAMWAFLRVTVERGSPSEPEKGEEIDMNGFGIRFDNLKET